MWFCWLGPWFFGLVGFFFSFLVVPFCIPPVGALLSFAQYIAFIDKKKNLC